MIQNFDGEKFQGKYNLDRDDYWIDGNGNLICPSLPDLTDADLLDCVITPNYSITPQQTLVAVGGTVTIGITGAPDTTETITIDGIQQDVQLDDNGQAEIAATMEDAGNVYIRDAHGNIAKVEVV